MQAQLAYLATVERVGDGDLRSTAVSLLLFVRRQSGGGIDRHIVRELFVSPGQRVYQMAAAHTIVHSIQVEDARTIRGPPGKADLFSIAQGHKPRAWCQVDAPDIARASRNRRQQEPASRIMSTAWAVQCLQIVSTGQALWIECAIHAYAVNPHAADLPARTQAPGNRWRAGAGRPAQS